MAGASAPATGASAAVEEADDSVGVRLLDAPVERRDDPRALVYIVDHLKPGESITRRIEVTNTTSDTLDVQLYAAAARVEAGAFLFGDGREANELTTWTAIDPSAVTVAPDGAAQATVRIDVPADATEGERYAVVWAEPPASTGGDVTVINRVGIRVYLSVGPGGEPGSTFTIQQLRAGRDDGGAPRLSAVVENTGGRALDLRGELSLAEGPGGISAGPFETPSATTVAVGETGEVTFSLDPALPTGPWNATVTLRSGRTEMSTDASVTFPERGEAPAQAGSGELDPRWVAIGAAVLLVLLLLLLLLARRRRRDRAQPPPVTERSPV